MRIALTLALSTSCRTKPDMSRGGVELIVSFQSVTREAEVEKGRVVIGRRLKHLGVEAIVIRVGTRIYIGLPAGRAAQSVDLVKAALVAARLEFREVDDGAELRELLHDVPNEAGIRLEAQPYKRPGGEVGETIAIEASRERRLEEVRRRLPAGVELLPELQSARLGATSKALYLAVRPAEVTGDDVASAQVQKNSRGPYVSVTFTQSGAKAFEQLTRRIVGHKLAIVLDGKITSAPLVTSAITGGQAQIDLGGMAPTEKLMAETMDLALMLDTGSLPAPIVFEEERAVAPAR
ncbi:MAG: hypothetical protein HY901_19085 [Deltaproteobacteria bacterium]|nr:hypothetical protein [Deltaproteobacteria bacterium]